MSQVQSLPEKSEKLTHEEIMSMRKQGLPKPASVTWANWNAPVELSPNHERMCWMCASGKSLHRIADETGVSYPRVSEILNSNIGKFRVKELQYEIYGKNTKKRFEALTSGAIDTIATIMQDGTERAGVRRACANDILDRSLGKPVQQVEHRDSSIRDLYNRLDDLFDKKMNVVETEKAPDPDIVDADYKEIEKETEETKDEVDDWIKETYK